MPLRIYAPFTSEQADGLNKFQTCKSCHTFACPNDSQNLIAIVDAGWMCPECDYTQNWAHAFMVRRGRRNA